MAIRRETGKWLRKKAKAGARAFPVGTVAFYGPDDRSATKVVAAVILSEGEEPVELRRWTSEDDLRRNSAVLEEVSAFFKSRNARSVGLIDGIIGCPHEEGIDYPEGEACPACPFWANRDRWTGALT